MGATGGSLTQSAVRGWYLTLVRPPGTPPNWVFPVAWGTLYTLIGISGWRVWRKVGAAPVLRAWGWQLAIGALWTPAFFGLNSTTAGMVVIVPFWLSIAWTIRRFAPVDRVAAWLLAPFLLWVSYATYLNLGFWWLNAF